MVRSYKELNVWKKGVDLVEETYRISVEFPNSEIYGLTSQIGRCAVSIPSNIAEGFRRQHNKEFKQFLSIALGSSAELETQIIIANKLNYVDKRETDSVCGSIDQISSMLVCLMKKM